MQTKFIAVVLLLNGSGTHWLLKQYRRGILTY
jgi:hypothetical protein